MRSRSANPEEVFPDFNQIAGYDEKQIPSPGTAYWIEEVFPPDWFIESLMVGPEQVNLQALRKELSVPKKFKRKRSKKH
jgi:hypothetical protein